MSCLKWPMAGFKVESCGATSKRSVDCDQIWRNFATLVFGKFLMVYFLFGKILSLLWLICYIIGLIFIVATGQILKNNLTNPVTLAVTQLLPNKANLLLNSYNLMQSKPLCGNMQQGDHLDWTRAYFFQISNGIGILF